MYKLKRESWTGIQMQELVKEKEKIYEDFITVFEIFHYQNRIVGPGI